MKLTMDQMAKELAADLGEDLGFNVTNKAAKKVLARVFEYVAGSLEEGNEVNVPGFGKFKVNDKPERDVRNPRTGEMMTIGAKRVLKFTSAKTLKDRVMG